MATAIKKTSKKPGPPPGCKPDFAGVPGAVITLPETLKIEWGLRRRNSSPYDALLRQLKDASDANPNAVLRFDSPRARASVTVRARKLGYKILFGEVGGALYVRFAGYLPDTDKGRAHSRERILKALKAGPLTSIQVADAVRRMGGEIDAGLATAILRQMAPAVTEGVDHRWRLADGGGK